MQEPFYTHVIPTCVTRNSAELWSSGESWSKKVQVPSHEVVGLYIRTCMEREKGSLVYSTASHSSEILISGDDRQSLRRPMASLLLERAPIYTQFHWFQGVKVSKAPSQPSCLAFSTRRFILQINMYTMKGMGIWNKWERTENGAEWVGICSWWSKFESKMVKGDASDRIEAGHCYLFLLTMCIMRSNYYVIFTKLCGRVSNEEY